MINPIIAIVPVASILALTFAFIFFRQMMKHSEGTDTMKRIASHVRKGALAYLKQQYKVVGKVVLVVAIILAILAFVFGLQNKWLPFAFVTGAFFSGLSGFFGMKAATYASARVANACRNSLNAGLKLAFRSGAVMGLSVVGLILLDIFVWFMLLNHFLPEMEPGFRLMGVTAIMLTFAMGASTQALFARVGGGIYTKAADVGADLVGKVEAGIPEDDPRNPATIADNVGDNVGDVAGLGSDLYESNNASILAAALLGAAAFIHHPESVQMNAVIAPMLIAALGAILSIVGMFTVRTGEGVSQKQLLKSLNGGIIKTAVLIVIASFFLLKYLGLPNYVGIWGSIVVGLLAGMGIGRVIEYYTSDSYKPTRDLAAAGETGPATVIIRGMGLGLVSSAIPILITVTAIVLSYMFSTGFYLGTDKLALGLYGIGIAAVGMLSTLGITIATDAYGPIADNAGGNAQMSGLEPEVRKRTDALDSLGNTTAATGKGFAIGSAAFTALAMLVAYFEEVRMIKIKVLARPDELVNGIPVKEAAFIDFVKHYEIHLMNPVVIVGMFIGVMAVFLFSGLTLNAVGRAAQKMVEEVRRQFRTIPGIMEGKAEPDYARCVEISTKGAQREMMMPACFALAFPVVVGLVFGVAGIAGLLIGAISSGFALAIFMANAGGAWDNAKKYIEAGNLGGKGSEAHKATVIGDTVGDPYKDTAGPSIDILIKLMMVVSLVTAGIAVVFSLI